MVAPVLADQAEDAIRKFLRATFDKRDAVLVIGPVAVRSSTKSLSIAVTAAVLAGANLAIWFPGESGPDSDSQYAQAVAGHFDDWHPPIMAWLWSLLRLLADGDGPMFCFQVACYWLGFALIAVALARAGRSHAAWAMLGVALFPSMLMLNGVLLKDVGMGVTFLLGLAALFCYRLQDRQVPAAIAAISLLLLVYGALVRANAVCALVPLVAYMVRPLWLRRPWWLLAVSIPLSLALVPAAHFFNHRVLQAEPLHPIRSLQIFDLTGIASYSADMAVFGTGNRFTRDEVDSCYSPAGWDRFAPWGECRFFWNRLAVSADLQASVEELDSSSALRAKPRSELPDLWIAAIVRHPLAYAQHRLAHFSSEIWRGASMAASDDAAPRSPGIVIYDLLTASALWLAVGAGLLIRLAFVRSAGAAAPIDAALALLLSGLTYGSVYLLIGVATELRYLFWTHIAIFTALVISWPELRLSSATRLPSYATQNVPAD
ncbi:MAG: hypothetical protein ACJ72H_16350 [Candidatus Sulfotelmatobacter sp.]